MNKQIEEMAKVICQECLTATEEKYCQNEVKDCMAYEYAKLFYRAGYRKGTDKFVLIEKSFLDEHCITNKEFVDDVRKETAREILHRLRNKRFTTMEGDRVVTWDDIEEIIEEDYGVEVE